MKQTEMDGGYTRWCHIRKCAGDWPGHAHILSFSPIFLPHTLSIVHLCCVHLSAVRNPKRQLENCLKKDHIVCANQSRQQNGMGGGVQHPASSQVTMPGMGRHYLERAQYSPPPNKLKTPLTQKRLLHPPTNNRESLGKGHDFLLI